MKLRIWLAGFAFGVMATSIFYRLQGGPGSVYGIVWSSLAGNLHRERIMKIGHNWHGDPYSNSLSAIHAAEGVTN